MNNLINVTNNTLMHFDRRVDKDYALQVHCLAIVICGLSGISTGLIIVAMAVLPRLREHRLWVMILGVSIGDLILALSHGMDHLLAVTQSDWPTEGPFCTFIAASKLYGFWYSSLWIVSIATCLGYAFSGDVINTRSLPNHYFVASTLILANIPWVVALSIQKLGPVSNLSGCTFVDGRMSLYFMSLWSLLFQGFLSLSYVFMAFRFLSFNENSQKKARKSIRKILVFPVIYVVQWLPFCVYVLMRSRGHFPPPGFYVFTVLTVNSGGVLNGIGYFGMLVLWPNRPKNGPTYG